MKKRILVALLCSLAYHVYAQGLPRLAVLAFTVNVSTTKILADVVSVRNLVESRMIASGNYQVISCEEIDKLLENQRIQMSSISSTENITKLQIQNISYIVSGSVDAVDSDYLIMVKILNVSTGQFSHSVDEFIEGTSREMINGVRTLIDRFIAGMGSEGDRVVQSQPSSLTQQSSSPTSTGSSDGVSARSVLVPAGTFTMGSRHVSISKAFYIGDHEVTEGEWLELIGSNPSYFKGDHLPVERVSWYDVIEYCNKRSIKEGLTPAYTIDKTRSDENNKSENDNVKWVLTWNRNANGYRLPTEAEWEWAMRGGRADSVLYEYSGSNSVEAVAWYSGNSGGKTHPVKMKSPNSLGLYDMSGNVWE